MCAAGNFSVQMSRPDQRMPWGFRLHGGADYNSPLIILKVTDDTPSQTCGLQAGDVITAINGMDTGLMRHKEAQDLIVGAGNSFTLNITRGVMMERTWKPQVTPVGPAPVGPTAPGQVFTRTSLKKAPEEDSHWDVKHNKTAVGFNAAQNGAQAAAAPMPTFNPVAAPMQGMPQQFQQQQQQPMQQQPQPTMPGPGMGGQANTPGGFRSVRAPVTKPGGPSRPAGPPLSKCFCCDRLITGVYVKVGGKPMIPECFKCSACGINLKNKGHFTVNEKLYCENCAQQAKAAQMISKEQNYQQLKKSQMQQQQANPGPFGGQQFQQPQQPFM